MLDERLVDLESQNSNFRQAYEHLFVDLVDSGRLSWRNLHPFVYKPQDTDHGMGGYVKELEQYWLKYDIVIAGVGEDGHVAALFPRHATLESNDAFVTLNDSPKPPVGRMSSSVRLIQTARAAFVFFVGESKQEAYRNFMDDGVDWWDCPAKILREVEELYIVTTLKK